LDIIGVDGDFIPSQVMIDEETGSFVDHQILVTTPLRSRRIRAADFMTRLLRKAAATPMPTSHWPSRVLPG
jgi:hypothetical protein